MLSKLTSNQVMRHATTRSQTGFMTVASRGFSKKDSLDGNTMNAGLINLGFAVFVREKYAVLVHRLQKFDRVMKPGLNFKMPLVDTIEYVHDLREQAVEISS